MRQAEVNAAHAQSVGMLASRTAQFDRGPTARLPDHLNVHPADTEPPAGAQRFHRGFLSGKTRSISFGRTAMALAVGNLPRCEDALEERTSMPPNGGFDTVDLRDVDAQANDHMATNLEKARADRLQ